MVPGLMALTSERTCGCSPLPQEESIAANANAATNVE